MANPKSIDKILSWYSKITKELLTKDLNRRLAEFAVITNDIISKLCEVLGFGYEGHYDNEKRELIMKFLIKPQNERKYCDN